jgi:hypothetical protein
LHFSRAGFGHNTSISFAYGMRRGDGGYLEIPAHQGGEEFIEPTALDSKTGKYAR